MPSRVEEFELSSSEFKWLYFKKPNWSEAELGALVKKREKMAELGEG
jgi:hypothetical protein